VTRWDATVTIESTVIAPLSAASPIKYTVGDTVTDATIVTVANPPIAPFASCADCG